MVWSNHLPNTTGKMSTDLSHLILLRVASQRIFRGMATESYPTSQTSITCPFPASVVRLRWEVRNSSYLIPEKWFIFKIKTKILQFKLKRERTNTGLYIFAKYHI